ncbi:MAG: ATP-binding cassette domain-containing protein [Paludibacteraceae bacterium]|nr:ATP-binding cassette domain-containing protein [Paludibacteraceae bacterium]
MKNKNEHIIIKNARVHNLKGVNLEIPRNKFIVITGLSGSGKSSLAFDTIYAEGQRRYVESLSSYVRQFLGRMNKPEVDMIKGIPPAIAIEQKVTNNNPRSTVGTTTEIYEYLKLLFARIGHTFSPKSGKEVKRHTVDDVIQHITSLHEGTTAVVLVPIEIKKEKQAVQLSTLNSQLTTFNSQGFARLMHDGEFIRISDILNNTDNNFSFLTPHSSLYLVVDRITTNKSNELRNRLYDSIETAFFEGKEYCTIAHKENDQWYYTEFSKSFEADGIKFELPSERMFSFNNPLGACPTCEGFGKILGIDPDLVIPDQSLSIYQDAVMPWRGAVMGQGKRDLILNAEKFKFPIHKPYFQLSDAQKQLLWTGNQYFMGLNDLFKDIESQQYKIQYRVMLSRYRGKTLCPDCHGTRLRKEANYVKINGKSISQLVDLPINELYSFITTLQLPEHEAEIAKRLIREITSRLEFLIDVGLEYLTLNRQSNTLSGGESQRINLATSLGSALVGSLYILDEPSIGLHPRDTQRLIKVLRQLQQLGNTVIVVEHDEEIMRAADYIIDIGPEAGRHGGEVVLTMHNAQCIMQNKSDLKLDLSQNCPNNNSNNCELCIVNCALKKSLTLQYLRGDLQIETPASRRRSSNYIEIKGATQNNLKGIDVKFPLGIMTAVTGVSGSGKSSLVRDVLYNALRRALDLQTEEKVHYGSLTGSLHLIKGVEIVDQNPIGKSSRSNPVTYLKAYDDIRKLFADQQLSKQMGFTPAHFSFNVDGGRCPICQGEGTVTVPMQFMADLVLPCEACHGKRFKNDVLEVRFHGANIHDVLEMTVNQAIEFFEAHSDTTTKKIVKRLKPLQDVGIGYIRLGQSSSTLSGGESQRVKLAYYLSQESQDHTFFIFDEPTTGLHTHDIRKLMTAFNALIKRGHTVLIIEHNLNVIKCVDHIIDIGPEGGARGGNVVVCGTPEKVAKCEKSHTGKALKPLLNNN